MFNTGAEASVPSCALVLCADRKKELRICAQGKATREDGPLIVSGRVDACVPEYARSASYAGLWRHRHGVALGRGWARRRRTQPVPKQSAGCGKQGGRAGGGRAGEAAGWHSVGRRRESG